MSRRVVITGFGAITPLGNDVESCWKSILEGKSGVARFKAFDSTKYNCKIAAEVKDFQPEIYYKNPKDARRSDRYSQMAIAASKQAVEISGISEGNFDPTRAGVYFGSGIGGLRTLEDQHERLLTKGPARVSPFTIPMLISDIGSGMISMEHNFQGPNFSIVSACATSAHNIGEAWRLIRWGDADLMLAGGSEAAIVPMGLSGFGNMRALSFRNDEPEKASRPFDRGRDGFVIGEGAGTVLLEELEHAQKRGANILGEIIGYGASGDAHHMTSPHPEGEGAARAMKLALGAAKIDPSKIDYINAHGTSTFAGDICETKAVKSVFGDHAKKVAISSTKSMTGHLLGAAGAVELITCLKAISKNVVPPTINLDDPDPECDLDYTPHQARPVPLKVAMSNSFGFGGHNATLIASEFI